MTIRRAINTDVTLLQQLNNEVFIDNSQYDDDLVIDWATSEHGKKYFSGLFEKPNAVVLIAEEDGTAIGYVACQKKVMNYRKSSNLEIDNIGVIPSHRSKTIGTQLIKAVKEWAKENGYKRLFVNSYYKNKRAIEFYKRNGFGELEVGLELSL